MNDNHERSADLGIQYALTCEPSIYTEKEMQHVRDEFKSLQTDFNNYRIMMQDRTWDAGRIITEITHNVQTERQLQTLCTNNSIFSQDYNRSQVRDVLLILNDDNLTKLKLLIETQT